MLLCAAKAPEERTIHYRIMPGLWLDGAEAIEVDMRFRGDADGETLLELPGEWAGADALWRQIKLLEIRGAPRLSGTYDRPVAHHRPRALIRVRYMVVSAYNADPGFDYQKGRPMFRPDWFFFHGESVFSRVAGRDAAPARFKWRKAPRGWSVASDLDHLLGKKTTVANMINSVAIGGKALKVVTRDTGGAPLRFATIGAWSFEPEELADEIARIVQATNAYWGDKASPFLVAMAPLGAVPTGVSFSGTGRTDAFSIASTGGFQLAHARRFLAHEYTHSWVPNELGAMPAEGEAADYWFSEGLTDYLAPRMLLRAGLWNLADYVADKNETLLRYGTSAARNAGAAEIAERFWQDGAVQQVSYDRGHLLAASLDARIAERTDGKQSLHDVLRAQRKLAKGSSKLATELFAQVLSERTGIDAAPLVERHARRGETVELPQVLFEECVRVATVSRLNFDRGFDAEATRRAGSVITGVDPAGAAYAAGMRDGMRLIGRESGTIGDSSVEIVYRVADAAGERLLRYLPQGKIEHQVQRMELSAVGEEQEKACRKRLTGDE